MMKKGLLVETRWVNGSEENVKPGDKVRIKKEYGGGSAEVVDFSPSKKFVIVKQGRNVKSVSPSDLLVRESVTADLLREVEAGIGVGMAGVDVPNPNDPDLQRINMYRARIARDNLELSKLVMKYQKKQQAAAQKPKQPKMQPGTYTPQQMKAMQQQSNANAAAAQQQGGAPAQGFPSLQATR